MIRVLSVWNIFLLFACVSLYIQSPLFLIDPGTGAHIAAGQWIVTHGRLPLSDPFMFGGAEPRLWLADQWLSCVLFYLGYTAGGFPLLAGAMQAVFILFLGLYLYPRAREHIGSAVLSVLAVLLAFKLGEIHFLLRGVFFSFLFFSGYLFICLSIEQRSRQGQPIRWWRHSAAVFCITVLWTNLHPSFVMGFALLGPAALGALRYTPTLRMLSGWIALGCAAVLGSLVNGYGYHLYPWIFTLQNSTFAMSHYQEWQPPELWSSTGIFFLGSLLFVAATYLCNRQYRSEVGTFLPLAVLAFAILGFDALRMIPYFGFVVLVPFGLALRALGRTLLQRMPRAVFTACSRIEARERRSVPPAVTTSLVAICLLVAGGTGTLPGVHEFSRKEFPVAALQFLQQHSAGQTVHVVNEMSWGGYLVFQGGNVIPYIDDRTNIYGDAFYERYFSMYNGSVSYASFARAVGGDYFLVSSTGALGKRLLEDEPQAVLYRDDVATLVDAGRL